MSHNSSSNSSSSSSYNSSSCASCESSCESSSESSTSSCNINLAGDIINNYNVICELGRGSYSIVWLVFCITNNNFYALKVQNPCDFNEGMEEVDILKKIPPNVQYINKLINYFIEIRFNKMIEEKYMCSVYNLCCGNLDGLIRKGNFNNGYNKTIVKKIFKQVCYGLNTIHTKLNGFHGDIKPDNILLCGINNRDKHYINLYEAADYSNLYIIAKKKYILENKIKKLSQEHKMKVRKLVHTKIIENMPIVNETQYMCDNKYIENPIIKISDFGFFCHDKDQYNESFGTCYYMAPEIILKGDCTTMIDIWALGCMLYELLTGKILFDPNDDMLIFSHLEMFIILCGNFDINFLKTTERYKTYFDNQGKLNNINKDKIYSTNSKDITNNIYNKLKEHNIDDLLAADLLEKMLRLTPTKRHSLNKLLNHPWLV